MSLVRPLGTILPGAVATMSTEPNDAHATAAQKIAMIVAPIARPIGEGGVSMISSAAGRKASSWPPRRSGGGLGKGTTVLSADAMEPRLEEMQLRVPTMRSDQLFMSAVLDYAAAFERDDTIGLADRR